MVRLGLDFVSEKFSEVSFVNSLSNFRLILWENGVILSARNFHEPYILSRAFNIHYHNNRVCNTDIIKGYNTQMSPLTNQKVVCSACFCGCLSTYVIH